MDSEQDRVGQNYAKTGCGITRGRRIVQPSVDGNAAACCQGGFQFTHSAHNFNGAFYTASVTVIPIFFVTLAVEVRAASQPVMRRMVALYRYRKLRRFESFRDRFHWLFRGMLVFLAGLLLPVVALGWAGEIAGLFALDDRAISPSRHLLVVIGVVTLPTVVLLWAIAIREREPTPLDEELDRLSRGRSEVIGGLSARLRSMETTTTRGGTGDDAEIRRTRRRLVALNRRDRRLIGSTDRARRSLQALREHHSLLARPSGDTTLRTKESQGSSRLGDARGSQGA